jgi:ADP-heptose:LPS heptosyltransferase
MHIAAAVDTPIIVLFGPYGDYVWGLCGDSYIVIMKRG